VIGALEVHVGVLREGGPNQRGLAGLTRSDERHDWVAGRVGAQDLGELAGDHSPV